MKPDSWTPGPYEIQLPPMRELFGVEETKDGFVFVGVKRLIGPPITHPAVRIHKAIEDEAPATAGGPKITGASYRRASVQMVRDELNHEFFVKTPDIIDRCGMKATSVYDILVMMLNDEEVERRKAGLSFSWRLL